jgi:hypothetical protein
MLREKHKLISGLIVIVGMDGKADVRVVAVNETMK